MRRAVAIGLVLAAGTVAGGCAGAIAGSPTYVTDVSTTINGLVATSEGGAVSYWVEFGADDSYGHASTHRSHTADPQTSFTVSVPIAGLTASTTYHYRVCAEDAKDGPHCSDDATFTTGSPGGRSGIAFSSSRGPGTGGNEYDVVAMPGSGGPVTNLTNAANDADVTPAWSPDARQLAYVLQRTTPQVFPIYALNADGTNKHALTGTSFHAFPAWSPDGTQIAYTGDVGGDPQIFVMDADGSHQHNISKGGDAQDPAWSPDGSRIVYSQRQEGGPERDIWVMNADGSGKTPLTTTTTSVSEDQPAWSPDGTKIAFSSYRGIHTFNTIDVMNADGSNPVTVSPAAAQDQLFPTWSPDGSAIAFSWKGDIYRIPAAGGTAIDLTNDAFVDTQPAWSPRP